MTGTQKGMLAGFAGNFIFGLSFLFSSRAFAAANAVFDGSDALPGADVPAVLSVRFLFSLLLMTALLPLLKIKLHFKGKPVWKLVLLGLFQPVIYFIGESFGLKLTGIVVSSVMIALVPVLCQIFSALFLREAPNPAQVLFCVLSVAGVIAVTLFSGKTGGKTYVAGIVFLSIAVLSAVAFNVLGRSISQTFTPFERTYFMFLVSAVFFTAYALLAAHGHPLLIIKPLASPVFVISILYLGGFSSVGAYLLVNYANTALPLARSSVFANVITVVSTTAGFLSGEPFGLPTLAACFVILVGVWGVQRFAPAEKQL
ncbi:MAG: DMT family transporter [Eubacteriales bacterium]